VLDHGQIGEHGRPGEVLTAELVARVFGVRLRHWTDPETGRIHLSFDRLTNPGSGTGAHPGGGTREMACEG
jgi:ABC-type cobalamin/Fe3+-siderophores transport system ATPase subunit